MAATTFPRFSDLLPELQLQLWHHGVLPTEHHALYFQYTKIGMVLPGAASRILFWRLAKLLVGQRSADGNRPSEASLGRNITMIFSNESAKLGNI